MMEYNFQIDSAAVSDRGLNEKRPHNEDSFLEISERGVFAVADGVGGAQAGEVASEMAMEIVGEAFINSKANSDSEAVMKDAIEHANTSIYQMSRDLPQLSTMATTIVALHISGNIATIGHVGDSRLYRLDGNGNLYRETQDHSVVEEEVRAGRMTPAQAANHPSRNVISRALGAESTVEVDMKTIMFEPQTTFLLCSDGITRHIDDFEIRQLLMVGENPAEICAEMKKMCYERGAEDNLTAVVVRVSQAVAPFSAQKPMPLATEFEEPTVASARQTGESLNEDEILEIDEAEIPTQNLQMPPMVDESKIPTAEYPTDSASSNVVEAVPFQEQTPATQEEIPFVSNEVPENSALAQTVEIAPQPAVNTAQTIEPDSEIFSSAEPEKSGGGFFGKLLLSLFLLLLGTAIGGAIAYYLLEMNKKTEVPPPMPSTVSQTDSEISIFEKSRRTIDENSAKYIEAHKDKADKNALDFYLLGRAYLLEHKFTEAKENFENAQKQLSNVPEHTRKTLENDIHIGLTIATNAVAQEKLKERMQVK